mgnify:CR=1 FL=1
MRGFAVVKWVSVAESSPGSGPYDVFYIETTDDDRVKRVAGMVEKPAVGDAPSNLVATGRYLLDRAIFSVLRRITPGKGGELQLTDAIDLLFSERCPIHVVVHEGIRHDLGLSLIHI